MADGSPQDRTPPEVPLAFPPIPKANESVMAEEARGIEADLEAKFEPELEPEPLPVRVRPFDLERYHPHTHILPAGGIRHFCDFILDVPKDLLLREPASHLSLIDVEGESRAFRGLMRVITNRPLLGTLVERWWDTTNSFHFPTTRKMTMTPYDFTMITSLGVGGDPIPFDIDMGEWEAAWVELLGARPPIYRTNMVKYSWFAEQFRGSEPETIEEME
ncbi:hypothetical protein ACSBR1_004389 [Camellia fascicularis]